MSSNNTYQGVRTAEGLKFVQFQDDVNFTEFFNISVDPQEMHNRAKDPTVATEVATLAARLDELRHCAGDSCRK